MKNNKILDFFLRPSPFLPNASAAQYLLFEVKYNIIQIKFCFHNETQFVCKKTIFHCIEKCVIVILNILVR